MKDLQDRIVPRKGRVARPHRQRAWSGILALPFSVVAIFLSETADAFPNYSIGHIVDVTFVNDDVLVHLDSGPPDNCAGTQLGWMRIPGTNRPMVGFVLGLLMRGDLSSARVTIYTGSVESSGYCSIGQLDPE